MRIHVGNLPRNVTDAQLGELAKPYGAVVSASVVTERTTGESKGFGFIEFNSADEGRAAITGLDGREVAGQNIKVSEARPKPARF